MKKTKFPFARVQQLVRDRRWDVYGSRPNDAAHAVGGDRVRLHALLVAIADDLNVGSFDKSVSLADGVVADVYFPCLSDPVLTSLRLGVEWRVWYVKVAIAEAEDGQEVVFFSVHQPDHAVPSQFSGRMARKIGGSDG